uniref:Trichome birefringence-like C-terminal domain-containing protein n=1 Tax=Picea sitchensis TaxID=3332 RepID=A9NU98_PICSI|nr:unknown [Picea sitchensis]
MCSPREWSETNVYHCYNQTGPVQFEGFRPPVPPQVLIVKEVVESMSFPVTLMDITGLSQFRKDGHPSIYSSVLSNEEKKHPEKFGDCSHWCLPGVPDTWNELLYVTLLFMGFTK